MTNNSPYNFNIICELILVKVKLTNKACSYVEAYEGIRRERYSIIMYEGVVAQRRKNWKGRKTCE